jgi:hypothetical protein
MISEILYRLNRAIRWLDTWTWRAYALTRLTLHPSDDDRQRPWGWWRRRDGLYYGAIRWGWRTDGCTWWQDVLRGAAVSGTYLDQAELARPSDCVAEPHN